MVKTVEEIKTKGDYLNFMHTEVRKKTYEHIREIIEICKDVDLNKFDDSSSRYRRDIMATIYDHVRSARNLDEIAGIMFEYDTMFDCRKRLGVEELKERINRNIEGYELGSYKRM